ncbi:MAG: cell envelope biogenesis protein OmpA [Bacteroidetes bacterium]|nr:MAG: cell envelope biogenesis protein OmpA [Bacteroidota bacterium]PIE88449.1 MAG: cell envelope biogenesis protein OmpA [Bacteroidota bacterium]
MKKIYLPAIILFLMGVSVSAQELPPNPEPGKCYVKCITADEFKDVTETIVVYPEYKKLVTYPATFKTVEERVLVKEASKKLVYVPAVYETVEVPYIKKAATENLEVVPATFGQDSKTFEIYPKVGRWEYTKLEDCPSANKEDCMVACFVEYPAKNQVVPFTTLTKDAFTRPVPVPEIPATYKKQVVKVPARVEEIEIPAVYDVIKRKVVDQPARTVEEVVPAVTKTVTRTILAKKGGMTVWEEIDCNLVTGNPNILPIFYEYNSAQITAGSGKIIDEYLLSLMREKPGIRIEIMSHTDSRGNDEYNQALSQQRAQSVVNYLVNKGISRSRLVAKGYGESRLVNRCGNGVKCTESEHQQNRRTEFRIIQ